MTEPEVGAPRDSLVELALLFFRLGATAFGGPAAHIALMEDEIVRRRAWMPREEFLDLLGMTNLIPGPNSTELAIHIGYQRAGWLGLVVAGTCFIFPAMVIVMIIAALYVSFGKLPEAAGILYGVKPVVIAVVLQALWGLVKTAVKNRFLAVLGVLALGATLLQVHELAVLFAAGAASILFRPDVWRKSPPALLFGGVPAVTAAGGATGGVAFGLWPLFLTFAKIGSVLFGSGYVLLAFLRSDFVERLHWLTEGQLLDAVAVGQLTPGPVFTTATFIGYVLGGTKGALVATVGIFLPAFVFVALSGLLVPRMRKSAMAGAFLDGINVASLALMVAVTLELGRAALIDVWTVVLAGSSAVLLLRFRVNSAWLVVGGAVVGVLLQGLPK